MDSSINTGNIPGFRTVDQLGIVVRDLDEAMKKFSMLWGVRNWYLDKKNPDSTDKVVFRGNRIQRDTDNALGYCGDLQLELVQPGNEESIYTTHLEKYGEGMHHLGFFVPNLEERLAEYAKLGIEPIQTCELYSKGGAVTRCAYLDNPCTNNITIELVETRMFGIHMPLKPILLKIGAMMGDLEKVSL